MATKNTTRMIIIACIALILITSEIGLEVEATRVTSEKSKWDCFPDFSEKCEAQRCNNYCLDYKKGGVCRSMAPGQRLVCCCDMS
ncbi:hypothetical protein RND81_02G208200 [Saponaria officinalis]|uniref:Uncharacterized protein n=1 Tax=Saponaria officinalis TaxID=3572 RepID=A0AAW1MNH9_SAPOF